MDETRTEVESSEEVRSRIERVYQELEGADGPRGALSWFADRARVEFKTVSRWARGVHPMPGPALALLEELERRAGLQ